MNNINWLAWPAQSQVVYLLGLRPETCISASQIVSPNAQIVLDKVALGNRGMSNTRGGSASAETGLRCVRKAAMPCLVTDIERLAAMIQDVTGEP